MVNQLSKFNPKYLSYAAIIFNLAIDEEQQVFGNDANGRQNLRRAYYQAIDEMLDDNVLNDPNKLRDYHKYHNELYYANKDVRRRNEWTKNQNMEYDSYFKFKKKNRRKFF